MTKEKNGQKQIKGKLIFTDQLKDQIFMQGEKLAKKLCKKEGIPYPPAKTIERIMQTIDTATGRVALAEWCIAHKQNMTTYRQGVKALDL